MILHLHGWASTGRNVKWTLLKWAFRDETIHSPTLPCNPPETVELIEDIVDGSFEPTAVVGTSLGGFYALWLAATRDLPAFIINPSLRPWETLRPFSGEIKRLETDDTFEWKPEYCDYLQEMGDKLKRMRIPQQRLHFYLSTDDELIDHREVPALFPEAASIKWFDRSGHVFRRFQEIMPDLREVLAGMRGGSAAGK